MRASELIEVLQRVIAEQGDLPVFGVWEGQVQPVEPRFMFIVSAPEPAIYLDVDNFRWPESGNLAGEEVTPE